MRSTNESTLGDLIDEMIRVYGLHDGMRRERIREVWNQKLPQAVVQRTRELSFQDGILTARMNSAVVRNELQLIREDIRRELNAELGGEVIGDLLIF